MTNPLPGPCLRQPSIMPQTTNPRKVGLGCRQVPLLTPPSLLMEPVVAGHHERDSTGGELGWHDRWMGTNGTLREPFLADDVNDLKPVLGVLSPLSTAVRQAVSSWSIRRRRPLSGLCRDRRVLTDLSRSPKYRRGSFSARVGTKIFKIDIRDGSLHYVLTLPAPAFGGTVLKAYDRRLCLGPDNRIWMFIGNSLYRISPDHGNLFEVLDTAPQSIVFVGESLYLHGGPHTSANQRALRLMWPNPPGGRQDRRAIASHFYSNWKE